MLREIPGIQPARMYDGCTRNAYHLYMFRYEKEKFANLPRAKFLKAHGGGGHAVLARLLAAQQGAVRPQQRALARLQEDLFQSSAWTQWTERNRCPENDRLCEEAVWFSQTMTAGGARRPWSRSPPACARCRPSRRRSRYDRSMATKITPMNNGSIRIEGDFEIFDQQGNRFGLGGRTAISLCRCGQSANKPFCDGSHARVGFESPIAARDLPPPAPKL